MQTAVNMTLRRKVDNQIKRMFGKKLININRLSNITFNKRIKRFLAGYTAITHLKGDFYFGTDFSARPNYIETDKGQKFFFPPAAYTLFVMNFSVYKERYIIVLNSNLAELSLDKVLSLFDTQTKQFIYSEKVSLKQATASS